MSLTNPQIRELKARAQLMKPQIKVGHDGLSEKFISALDELLKANTEYAGAAPAGEELHG